MVSKKKYHIIYSEEFNSREDAEKFAELLNSILALGDVFEVEETVDKASIRYNADAKEEGDSL